MFNFKNISQLKTTAFGIALILISLLFQFYLFSKSDYSINYYNVGLLISGIGFLFAPDNMIELLRSIINKKTKEQN